jgi:SAM-dependent methyltransferase
MNKGQYLTTQKEIRFIVVYMLSYLSKGCGNGKYLDVNPDIFKVGCDRCESLCAIAREKEHQVMVCDNLNLPYRDNSYDACLSIAVIHHFTTTERRVRALRELARILRIGGRILISVWAMEQRYRKAR